MKTLVLAFLLSSSSLVVSAQPFEVLPAFGRQGTQVFLRGVPGCPGSTCASKGVRFNGVEASMVVTILGLLANVPALPEGLVDVSVVSPDGSLLTAKGAFEYTTHFDAHDYARVLFPLTYGGPGAGGSNWTSSNLVSNQGPVGIPTIPAIWFPQGIGETQRTTLPGLTSAMMPTRSTDGGSLLLVPHGLEQFVAFSSHIQDLSRTGTNLGTEIKVVLEKDTASEVRIVGVPADARYRPRLRVYDIDGDERPVAIRVGVAAGLAVLDTTLSPRRSFVCVTTPCEDAAFASLDFQTSTATIPNIGTVDVIVTGQEGRRLWAFVSLTNNETQQVTTYSPN